ncbi:MAG: hypothetical protein JNM27_01400, partial [Leptospirales bacterium]|nr:hypothetical protein [Leptospirales bacterium]
MPRWLAIYALLFLASAALHAEAVLVPPGDFSIEVGPYTSVWIDEGSTVEMPEVQSRTFEPNPRGNLTFGFKRGTIWIRFSLKNPGPETRDLRFVAASPLVEDVVLYAVSHGTVSAQGGGSNRRFAERPIQYTHLTFPLQLAPGEEIQFLMRARSELRTDFPFILQSTGAFARKQTRELLIHGFYFGILFIAIAYNMVLFL